MRRSDEGHHLDARKTLTAGAAPSFTRRAMLQAGAGLGVALALERSGIAADVSNSGPVSLDLGGSAWTLQQEGEAARIPAQIPGSTYTNLLAAGKIPDPFFGENNGKVQWVAEKIWIFERRFDVAPALLGKQNIELVCHGLDTLVTVRLNGREIGRGDNMFRTWTFDIKPHLRRKGNHLEFRFDALTSYVEARRAAYKQQYGVDLSNERSWVRKAPYMWGWDWCRPILTQGIWKNIEVIGYATRILDVGISQTHLPGGGMQLAIKTEVAGEAAGATVEAQVSLAGSVVATATGAIDQSAATVQAAVASPQLWWPYGMGDQPLYTVSLQLRDAHGVVVDTASRRIGLRTIEVVPPTQERALHLKVNDRPVFAKGADWIPADNMPTRVTPELLRWYMEKAVDCNFNFIRLWGGGYYEEDELFDLCDELGIMLQFEFKFANASYPVKDTSWMANLRAEVEQQTRRCRNHPSIVIWSGNNEIEYFDGYETLFRDFIGSIVRQLVPGAFYEVGSGAHGSGDIHSWGVWHGNDPVESYLKIEGFVTEFGMQSTPVPMTVQSFTNADDRQSVFSPVMQYHELDGSGHGMQIIMDYTEANFGATPKSFDDTLWLTNVNQAWMVKYAVEHWRRDMPRSMAAVIWQYNDCWPCSSWSMVDSLRREKPLLYQSKHFFAPVLVSGMPDVKTGSVPIHVISDGRSVIAGELSWTVTNTAGDLLREGSNKVLVPPSTSVQAEHLNLSDLVKAHGAASLLIWTEVVVEGAVVAKNILFFGRPAELKLDEPHLAVDVSGGETRYQVQVAANVPALWVWANVQGVHAKYSDNFFDVRRERVAALEVVLDAPMTPFEFRRRLEVRSVYDIAPGMRNGKASPA